MHILRLALPLLFTVACHASSSVDDLLRQGDYHLARQQAETELANATDQASRWQAQRDLARSWLRQDNHLKAGELLQSLLYGPQAVPADSLLYADLLDAWFEILRDSSRYKEADPVGTQALALRIQLLGPQHLLVAESLNNLALLRQYTGNYREAIRLHEQALTMRKSLAGESSPEVAESLHNLGTLYNRKKDWSTAEQYLQQTLTLKQQIMPATHPSIRVTKARLAANYIDSKHYNRAIPLFEEVLAAEQGSTNSSPLHQAIVLRELADAHQYLRHVEISERYYLQALDLFAANVGKQHYAYAVALNGLGWLYKMNGKPEQGKNMIAESERLFDAIK